MRAQLSSCPSGGSGIVSICGNPAGMQGDHHVWYLNIPQLIFKQPWALSGVEFGLWWLRSCRAGCPQQEPPGDGPCSVPGDGLGGGFVAENGLKTAQMMQSPCQGVADNPNLLLEIRAQGCKIHFRSGIGVWDSKLEPHLDPIL